MRRLIDIDKLCNDLMERWSIADKKKEDLIRAVMADVVTPIVVSQPTVDAVEVVRCKDCKYAEVADKEDRQDGYTCQFHRGSIWFSGSYCSWAERRQNERSD